MSKTVLIIIGVLVLLMGIAGVIPVWGMVTEPTWHAIVKIVVGLVGIYVGATDK